MHLEGTVTINAPRATVWAFLTDPYQVSQCAPGVEKIEVLEPGRTFRGTAAVGFGSVKARFVGHAEWLELDRPNRAKMKAHGTAPGSATDVLSEMNLLDAASGSTELRWTAEVVIVGQLASLAARLMGPVSQKLVGLFFDCVRQKIEAAGAAAPAAQPAAAERPAAESMAADAPAPEPAAAAPDSAHPPATQAADAPAAAAGTSPPEGAPVEPPA